MKTWKIILTFSLLACTISGVARTQQGIVKTKGRLNSDGSVSAGQRIAGASVTVKGRATVLSKQNGTFSFPMPDKVYYLQSVQKQGYVLTDPDVLSRQYAYSVNPLELVLETPEQQADDRLAAERRIRRTLRQQLQAKEDEIEALRSEKKLSDEAYRKQLQELYAMQESNEKLISEMAERYSKIDFDKVDDFNRRISQLILEGRLTEADSLLNTKGDINSRAVTLRQHQDANAKAEQEIKKRQKKLEKSKALTQKELEDLAQDCYSKFEIFKMQHQNDSAAYYIELRASLDTMNTKWQISAGEFVRDYLAKYDMALVYHKRALYSSIIHHKYDSCCTEVAIIYNDMGGDYSHKGNVKLAKLYFEKAISILKQTEGINKLNLAKCYDNLGSVYWEKMELDSAYYYVSFALDLRKQYDDTSREVAISYNNIGNICSSKGDYKKGIEYYQAAIDIWEKLHGDNSEEIAIVLNSLGMAYKGMKQPDIAISYINKSIMIGKKVVGHNHPDIGRRYNNLGASYDDKGVLDSALIYYNKALDIILPITGRQSGLISSIYGNIGGVYLKQGDYESSLNNVMLSTEIDMELYGEKNPNVAIDFANISSIYLKKGDKQKALEFVRKAHNIFVEKLGLEHPYTKIVSQKIIEIEKAIQ